MGTVRTHIIWYPSGAVEQSVRVRRQFLCKMAVTAALVLLGSVSSECPSYLSRESKQRVCSKP